MRQDQPVERPSAAARQLDVSFDYVACLQETWGDSLNARQRIVLDPMHGCWVNRARRYLQAIFPECMVSVVHDKPDTESAGRALDCRQHEHLEELCDAVYREHADLGIAFSGNGNHVAVVDNEAVPLTAEETTSVLLESLGTRLSGKPFVYDLKFSDRIPETARRLGAEPLMERSGQTFLRGRMRQTGAVFGAETDGRYYYAELDGGEDGLFTACRVIAHLAHSGRKLADLRRECPAVFVTPDLRLPLEAGAQADILREVREAWSQYPQCSIEGVRVEVPGGWALVRSAVAEPALVFRFESIDWPGLDDLVRRFCRSLPAVSEVLWQSYQTMMGTA